MTVGKPPDLGAIASVEWDRIVERVAPVEAFDLYALAQYCRAYEKWRLSEEKVTHNG